jgi:hypothetical protein
MAASSGVGSSVPFYGPVDFGSVPRHEAGYVKMPKYVYENCNQQVRNNYSDGLLAGIRVQTQEITPAMRKLVALLPKDQQVKKEEEWDWVYGLDYLERTYLSDPSFRQRAPLFTSKEIIHINGLLSRCANAHPGEFRQKNIDWPKRDLNMTESLGKQYLAGFVLHKYGQTAGEDEHQTDLFWKISDPSCDKPPVCEVKVSALKLKIKSVQLHGNKLSTEVVMDFSTGKPADLSKIDVSRVDEWAKQYPGKKKGTIDAVKWLRAHCHTFPPHQQIPGEVQKSLDVLSSPDMHPIEKACRIWFDIVRIHISHEANKREGKALGSLILLAHGYLPPEITGEDGKRYVKLLEEGFETKDGHIPFMHFIVEQMKKTYEKYAAIPGYLEPYQAPDAALSEQVS